MVGDEIEEGVCHFAKEFVYHTKEFGGGESTENIFKGSWICNQIFLILFFREWYFRFMEDEGETRGERGQEAVVIVQAGDTECLN